MRPKKTKRATAQAANVTFELHTLGWQAFQNLCNHIAGEVLGQTVATFSPSNDAGQDGAFQGEWKTIKNETFAGRFIIQCKFTALRDRHLSLRDLGDELAKAAKLAAKDQAHTYILLTNAKVTGSANIEIRMAFLALSGIKYFDLYGSEWITQQILQSKRLRAFVPRIYGLGDLTQILDERVYRQAQEILLSWKENLATFVPTAAHRKSVEALWEFGFVLLLGEPMAGKSTIAAALALAAADQWNCLPVFISHPDDFKSHWNPDELSQFFWVDDAFGQTQYDSSLASGWNRTFPLMSAAIRKGARILFTSRTYIYRSAERDLKSASFPAIRNNRVEIYVDQLTSEEKNQILYNHLRLGTQPQRFRALIKPHLLNIANSNKFFPEVARRLGNPFFTKLLDVELVQLMRFVEEPKEYLLEIIRQLDRLSFAALALLFMRNGQVSIPPRIEPTETEAMALLGTDLLQLREAFLSLENNLVSRVFKNGEYFWRFRHPSIRDAMAIHVAARPDLIDIYLGGVKVEELLKEVVCGDIEFAGATVHIPISRYSLVLFKLRTNNYDKWFFVSHLLPFLCRRCSTDFLVAWLSENSSHFEELQTAWGLGSYSVCLFLSRVYKSGHLNEEYRKSFVSAVVDYAIKNAELIFLAEEFRCLLTQGELCSIVDRLKDGLVPRLDKILDELVESYTENDVTPAEYLDDFSSNLVRLRELTEDATNTDEFDSIEMLLAKAIDQLEDWNAEREAEEENKREEEDKKEENRREAERRRDAEMEEYASIAFELEPRPKNQSVPILRVTPRAGNHHSPARRSIFDDIDS